MLEYSKIFNESNRTNTEEALDKEKFNDYLCSFETTIFKYEIESKTIRAKSYHYTKQLGLEVFQMRC